MAASVIPALIDAIHDQLATAFAANRSGFEHVDVIDGPDVLEGGDALQVGVSDPDADYGTQAATASETPGPFGTRRPRDERGVIWLTASSWNGDGDMKTARDRVAAIAEAVADLARSSGTFGVPNVLWVGQGPSKALWQAQDTAGARARLTFSVGFFARI